MNKAIIRKVGNSAAITLNKEALTRLNAKEGDQVFLTPDGDGGLRLTVHDPEFEEQMKIAEQVMREDRDALKALA